jgi:hypothetical protein
MHVNKAVGLPTEGVRLTETSSWKAASTYRSPAIAMGKKIRGWLLAKSKQNIMAL